ncbi:baculoviral IAP repeat-containing protein 7-B-like isoform X2 [Aphis gossypii]|uniref:baculoviral IAP repeat-containing protein 7-B-like isoform X2 n=1 Tax=Aphis gossypii TaxID=80765 RepID=UPI002158EA53|nr:baculoviral IAP repeat-containing protein 7-B-like isoform X2 [Aphis gossypii]
MTPSPNHRAAPNPVTVRNILIINNKVINISNGCPVILNTSSPANESTDNSLEPISRSMSNETPSWDLSTYENRLKTFDGVWKLQFITPNQMAKAGLYYLGIQDRVRCLFCSKEFDYWQPGDDPTVEHKRQSPQCPFFNDSSAGYDVCGLFGSAPADVKSNILSNTAQDILEAVGVLQVMKNPSHKEYALLEARLKSFEKCMIPLKQDVQTLCEAGFFYIGNGQNDQMLCFYCSQGLKDWEDDDDPWTEHAKWSCTCSYVLLSKGLKFVEQANSEMCTETSKLNIPTLFNFFAEHKDMTFFENNLKVNSTKRKLDQSEISDISQIKISSDEILHLSQKRDPNTMPDSMLCKICYKEEMKVAFIPCGHVIACIQCAVTLEQCAVCRQPFTRAMRVYLSMDDKKGTDLEELPCSSSQCLEEQLDPMTCKVCHKEEMAEAFIPCRHVYACVKCAADMNECPVCTEKFCATMQVYL